jgi:hypothetical protein
MMAKEAKGEKVSRKRRGEWARETRMVDMPNVGQVPAVVCIVKHRGHTWEVPDTKEGRARAVALIRGVEERIHDCAYMGRLQEQVSKLARRWPSEGLDSEVGGALAKAADLLRNALALATKEQ